LSDSTFNIASGRTLTMGGGSTAFLSGTSAGQGTLLLNAASAKTFTANGNPSVNMGNPTTGIGGLVISNNCTMTESGSFVIGNTGGGVVTLNSPTAAFNTTGGGVITIGRSSGSASSGRLTLINGSINTTASTGAGMIVGYQLNTSTAKGVLNVQGGTLTVPQMLNIGGSMSAGTATVTISGGTVTVGTNNFGGTTGSISTNGSASLTMTGGALYLGAGGMNSVGTGSFTSSRTLSGGTVGATANWSSSLPMTLATTGGSITFQAADAAAVARNIILSGILSSSGGLIKTGNGTLTLSGANTYTGTTAINAGTLALVEPGSISNSAVINIASGTTLDVTGRTDDALTLRSGKTLTGNGNINGKLTTVAGSILLPGASIGTLTVTNDIVLAGSLLLELNRTNTQTSDKLNSILGIITGGGTLTVTNIGSSLQAGDTFQLFSSAVSGFTTVKLPTIDLSLVWTNKLAVDGSIQVLAVPPPVNPLPGQIQFSASGNTLNFSWPTNAGWLLQMQTNSLADTNWVTLPGSDSMTSTNIAIDPANGSVFYRMVHP
jgi:autotransporter-associated beta strand protein